MMLTTSSTDYCPEVKTAMMLEKDFGTSPKLLEPGTRRIINSHLRYHDMPPSILNNTRLEILLHVACNIVHTDCM